MHNHQQIQLIEQFGSNAIIEKLEDYVTEKRKQRIQSVLDSRINRIHLAIESPCDINNALAAIRSSEVFGISNVHIISPEGAAGAVKLLTQGAYYWIQVHYYPDLETFLKVAKKNQWQLAGGVVNATTPLSAVPITAPLCLMIGNEHRGLSPDCAKALDHPYTIPMHGMTESLNLSVSAAVSLYDTTSRKRQQLGTTGDLTRAEYRHAQAHYYMRSVNPRLLQHFKQLPHKKPNQ